MRKGFTLIEVVITLGLVAVMTGLIVPNYIRTNKVQKVVQMFERTKQVYVQARDSAVNGKQSCGAVLFRGWRVRLVGANLILEGVCSASDYPTGVITFSTTTIPVIAGTSISYSQALANGILFRPGGRGIYPDLPTAGAGSTITVTISETADATNNRTFTINGYGRVQ